ncbi:MAG: response regulator [Candidatus Rokubacteria bacterium]|nr:response regulator [Candidatus Rokubacteria bacterium]
MVNDVADARELVSTILAVGGYTVVEAATGTEALRRVEDEPDLVVLDVHLPDMDGFEVCRRIKSDPRSAATPVVQISAIFSRTEHQVRGLTGGADAYLTKPFEPELLVATVNALMRLRTIERELSRSNRALRLQHELTQALLDGSKADIAPRVLMTIADALGAEVGELWRIDRLDDTLIRDGVWYAPGLRNPAPLDRATDGMRIPRKAGIAGCAWDHASVEWVDNLDARLLPARAAAVRALGLRSATVVPIVTREGVAGAVVLFHRSGGRLPEDLVRLASDAGGRVGLFIERRRNAEALRRAEEQLVQAQKMEAVGRLAGGIAHDFNNLLTVIGGHAQLLVEGLPGDSPARYEAQLIATAADRAATLTAGLLAFSRKQGVHPRVLALDELLRSMSGMLRRMLGENIAVSVETPSDVGHVRADRGQIEQGVMNLAVNARDAMPTGGRLTLSLANVDLEASETETLPPGVYVLLTVTDTGVGMDAETRARAFEPFYTTKATGKGTDLGLSTVYGIVTQSAGDVRVESEPGRGTTFRIFLPRVDAPADAAPAPSAAPLPTGIETVLVVEDEDAVRSLAVAALRKLGYTVLEAPDAERAVEVFAQHGTRVDLLVTDVVMPGVNGPLLAERLRERDAALRVLYVSGYAEEAPDTAAFLPKPYTGVSLARKVREVLDA